MSRLHGLSRPARALRIDLGAALFLVISFVLPFSVFANSIEVEQFVRAGRLPEALQAARQVLQEIRKSGADADVARALNLVGELALEVEGPASAYEYLSEALTLQIRLSGTNATETLLIQRSLARTKWKMGLRTEAERLYTVVVEGLRTTLGKDNLETALTMIEASETLGLTKNTHNMMEQALPVLRRAAVYDPRVARGWIGIARFRCNMRDFHAALEAATTAVEISERLSGLRHPDTGAALDALAEALHGVGDLAAARDVAERALAIHEGVFGVGHARSQTSRSRLKAIRQDAGEVASGESGPLHSQPDDGSPEAAARLYERALSLHAGGRVDEAEPLFRRALSIQERTLGLKDLSTAETMKCLALVALDQGDRAEALDLSRRNFEVSFQATADILRFATERQRLTYLSSLSPFDLPATLASAEDILKATLRYKGLGLDSIVEDARRADEEQDPELTRLRQLKIRRDALELAGSSLSDNLDTERSGIERQIDRLETDLARRAAGLGQVRSAFAVDQHELRSAFAPGAALVEFVRYRHYLGLGTSEDRYGALILSKTEGPRWIPLGPASVLDELALAYRDVVQSKAIVRAIRHHERTGRPWSDVVLSRMYEVTWAPIERSLPRSTETVVICPDGATCFVSFAALPTPSGGFVADSYTVVYVTSARELTSHARRRSNNGLVALFGDPLFAPAETPTAKPPDGEASVAFSPLEFTRTECKSIEQTCREAQVTVQTFLGPEASEKHVRSVQSPLILHVATHGYYEPATKTGNNNDPLEPMFRSGLALAGAQATVDGWSQGRSVDPLDDGILTAREAASLDLRGTRMVVLSACDTGLGEPLKGEGVLGLRRGFLQAGAESLLVTLWPIRDMETAQLMRDVYEQVLRDGPGSLAQVQRDWLRALKDKRGTLEAVRIAGPFILTIRGQDLLGARPGRS